MSTHPGLRRPHHPMLAPLRLVPQRLAYRIALLAAILAAVAATTIWQLWPRAQTPSATTAPTWFQPIAAYYHNDPAITPQFDFASLYSGSPPWFHRIAAYYHYNPAITPQFDFASLYGGPPAGWHPER
jgi:hypothetical protein